MAIEMIFKKNLKRRQLSVLRSNKGFSLLEVIIATVIFSIIIAIIINSRNEQTDNFMSQNQLVEMQQSMRASMIILTREIRKIGYDPHISTPGVDFTYGAGFTDANTLTFAYVADNDFDITTGAAIDNDNDGFFNEPNELQTVSIAVDGSNDLWLNDPVVPADNQRIAQNVQSLTFTYLNSLGAPIAIPAAPGSGVESIRIDLTLTPDSRYIYESGNNRTLTTIVKCRNL